MTQPGAPLPIDPAIDRLLAETFLRLRQERFDEVESRLRELHALAPEHPGVLEIEGDLAFARAQYRDAERLYGQARALDPANAKLEEKFATAVVKVREPELLSLTPPDDDPWNRHYRRQIWASAGLSALFPGLGQLYNGDLLKGGLVLVGAVMLIFAQLNGLIGAAARLKLEGYPVTVNDLIAACFKGTSLFMLLLYAAVWIYAIIDAAMVAQENA
jgi:hypothetical protein